MGLGYIKRFILKTSNSMCRQLDELVEMANLPMLYCSLAMRYVDDSMVKYCKNQDKYRRRTLFCDFDDFNPINSGCSCCELCANVVTVKFKHCLHDALVFTIIQLTILSTVISSIH